ncbi:SGNH/GDSL hydrolase family protein [soil metagenome]
MLSTLSLGLLLGFLSAPDDPAPGDLPVVVLIGDSIRIGYAPRVIERLEGKARVSNPDRNGGDTSNVLAFLDEWAIRTNPAVIHINAGLHDLKYDREAGEHQVKRDDYRANLEKILNRLESETSARLIFATTTPIDEGRHNRVKPFDRREADVKHYNATALEVLKSHPEIVVHDLHAVAESLGIESALVADGVHFTPEASKALGDRVADQIEQALAERSRAARVKGTLDLDVP